MSVVVDTNLVVATIIPLPYSEASSEKMASWKQRGEKILAPVLWEYELITALHRSLSQGRLTSDQAHYALRQAIILNLESISPTENLHRSALAWAKHLGQSKAYDSQYLALAEQEGAELWTGDQRLANRANQLGIGWVHWVGEY